MKTITLDSVVKTAAKIIDAFTVKDDETYARIRNRSSRVRTKVYYPETFISESEISDYKRAQARKSVK